MQPVKILYDFFITELKKYRSIYFLIITLLIIFYLFIKFTLGGIIVSFKEELNNFTSETFWEKLEKEIYRTKLNPIPEDKIESISDNLADIYIQNIIPIISKFNSKIDNSD